MDDFTCPSVRHLTLSVFWVSLLGIPKSLVIWVRGYPKHGDTQITVTPCLGADQKARELWGRDWDSCYSGQTAQA